MTTEVSKHIAGKIYAVMAPSIFKCYIGSTIQTLTDRWSGHIYRKEMMGAPTQIILIEDYICKTIQELRKREAVWIAAMGDMCINKRKNEGVAMGLTLRERSIIYGSLRNPTRDKTIHNCICGGTYTYTHKTRHFKTQRHLKSGSLLQVINNAIQ